MENNYGAVVEKAKIKKDVAEPFKALSAEEYKQLSQVNRLKYRRDKATEDLREYTTKNKSSTKKDDDRRKILTGAMLAHIIKDPTSEEARIFVHWVVHADLTDTAIKQCMDEYLKKNTDRKLFGLVPLPKE